VIDPGYDGTLTGLVLTFLDFHMKSFVNGGFFDESFIRQWNGTSDLNLLNRNIHRLKGYLKKSKIDLEIASLAELGDLSVSNGKMNILSAFRIIGKMHDEVFTHDNIIIPSFYFDVEYDIHVLPEFQAELDLNEQKEKYSEIFIKIQNAHHKMQQLIQESMPKIPCFRGYFEL
jgi:hypothetical protein